MRASENTTCAQCGDQFKQAYNGARKYCTKCSDLRHKEAVARNNAKTNVRLELSKRQKFNEGFASWLSGKEPPYGNSAACGVKVASRKYHHEKVVVACDEPDVVLAYDPTLAKDAVAEKPTFEEAIV